MLVVCFPIYADMLLRYLMMLYVEGGEQCMDQYNRPGVKIYPAGRVWHEHCCVLCDVCCVVCDVYCVLRAV